MDETKSYCSVGNSLIHHEMSEVVYCSSMAVEVMMTKGLCQGEGNAVSSHQEFVHNCQGLFLK